MHVGEYLIWEFIGTVISLSWKPNHLKLLNIDRTELFGIIFDAVAYIHRASYTLKIFEEDGNIYEVQICASIYIVSLRNIFVQT